MQLHIVMMCTLLLGAAVSVTAGGDMPSVILDNPPLPARNSDELKVAAISSMERAEQFTPLVAREPGITLDTVSQVLPPSGHSAPMEQGLLAFSTPVSACYAANAATPTVALEAPPGAWSDITAVFRPSRWADPFRPGGPLSFLNLECWFTVPGRTSLTLLGTAVVAGAIVTLTDNGGGDKDSSTATTTPTTSPSGTGSGGSRNKPDNSGTNTDTSGSGGSGGGGGGGSGDGGGGFTEEEG